MRPFVRIIVCCMALKVSLVIGDEEDAPKLFCMAPSSLSTFPEMREKPPQLTSLEAEPTSVINGTVNCFVIRSDFCAHLPIRRFIQPYLATEQLGLTTAGLVERKSSKSYGAQRHNFLRTYGQRNPHKSPQPKRGL